MATHIHACILLILSFPFPFKRFNYNKVTLLGKLCILLVQLVLGQLCTSLVLVQQNQNFWYQPSILFLHFLLVPRIIWGETLLTKQRKEWCKWHAVLITCVPLRLVYWMTEDRWTCLLFTFSSSKVEVKIDNVRAAIVALRRAKLLCKARLEERICWDSKWFSVKSTCFDALVCLNPVP